MATTTAISTLAEMCHLPMSGLLPQQVRPVSTSEPPVRRDMSLGVRVGAARTLAPFLRESFEQPMHNDEMHVFEHLHVYRVNA